VRLDPLVAGYQEYSPFLTPDGSPLYYSAPTTGTAGYTELFLAHRNAAGGFDTPAVVAELSSPLMDDNPVLTPDLLTIFFSSNRAGGTFGGTYGIWTASRAKVTDPFGTPRVISELNSSGRDAPSWVSADGCTLYISREDGVSVAHRLP